MLSACMYNKALGFLDFFLCRHGGSQFQPPAQIRTSRLWSLGTILVVSFTSTAVRFQSSNQRTTGEWCARPRFDAKNALSFHCMRLENPRFDHFDAVCWTVQHKVYAGPRNRRCPRLSLFSVLRSPLFTCSCQLRIHSSNRAHMRLSP